MNKCEELKIAHAWRSNDELVGFSFVNSQICANCGLKKTHCTDTKEWWRYSDGRPDEPIINMRPV